ncbi:LuxR family two component transcriptional regulator [Curtobacterium sp. PhB130]|uniref:response regulator transcription factor n=1 Tax=unclassified Curtobacterium TaxID=257496 RepID=UPI000F4CFE62|nr:MULTISPECIES: response regulator transcription factor [unclassified Curtobacterium]ROP66475.1 LuxR family two component transcriptional regulator [Curtobacterium sp. ZW137]ROS71936.1 LuxR family two component transcriptional regulator [Curtobacterium sp. PhB130]
MIKIALVDDQDMIRFGLRAILSTYESFDVAVEAGDGLAAIQAMEASPVDVVLMDIRMPGIDGVETTRRLRQRWNGDELKIVVLTTFEHDETVLAALRAGANGYLSKSAGPRELVAAIEEVLGGGGALSAAAAAALIGRVANEPDHPIDEQLVERFATLTPRELDVTRAIAAGSDVNTIAHTLFLSPYTVKTHANRAMAKVGARDRAQLVAFAFSAGVRPVR